MYTGEFVWDADKNDRLKKERKISFESVVELLRESNFIVLKNSSINHPEQDMFVIDVKPNPLVVPFTIKDSGEIFLITVFFSRKYKKLFQGSIQ